MSLKLWSQNLTPVKILKMCLPIPFGYHARPLSPSFAFALVRKTERKLGSEGWFSGPSQGVQLYLNYMGSVAVVSHVCPLLLLSDVRLSLPRGPDDAAAAA